MSDYFSTSFADYYDAKEDLSSTDRQLHIEDLMIMSGLVESAEEAYDLLGYIDLREMAASATYQGKDYWNTPKIPLFMDKEDIYYLRQFPPMFWKQALSHRYNHLVIDTHQKKAAGQEVPDWQWIQLRRGQTFSFFVDTGANALHDRLTQQMDVDALRQASYGDRESYEGVGKRYWNFQFDDPVLLDVEEEMERAKRDRQEEATGQKPKSRKKRASPVWVTRDYVGVGEFTAEKRLDQWLSGIAQGWLGKTGSDTMRHSDNWGGGGKKERIVHSPEWVERFVEAWRRHMRIALYESYLAQEKLIASGERTTRTLNRKLIDNLLVEHDGQGGVIWKALRPDGKIYSTRPYRLPVLLPGKLVDSRSKKQHDQYMSAADQVREALTHKGKDQIESDSKLKQLLYQMKGKKLTEFVEGEQSDLRDEAGRLKPDVLERRLDVLARAESLLAVKYWLKENGIDVDAVDHGKISSNGELRKMLRKKLAEFLLYAKRRAAHIKQTAKRYDAWDYALGDHNDAHARLYHTTGFGTVHPNRQQKMQMMDNPDDWWKILVYYFGEAADINGQSVVLPFTVTNVEDRHNLPRVAKYWSDKSAVRLGIEGALGSEIVQRHVPEWVALNNARDELFQVINQWMMFQTGHGTFRNFLDAYQHGEPEELESTGKTLRSRIRTMSRNFVLSLFQLNLTGRGSVRTRNRAMGSLDTSTGDNAELGDFLANQEADLKDIAQTLYPNQHRRTRPESSGPSMRIGHSIEVVRRAQNAAVEIARRSAPELGGAYEKLAAKLTGDLTRFIIYRNLYIYDHKRQKKRWTMDAANKYALEMLKKEVDTMAAATEHGGGEEEQQQVDRAFLQTFAMSLVGDDFAKSGVPQQTVVSIAQEPDRSTYKELRGYLASKKIGNVNLSQHPQFLQILEAVLAAVDQHMQKTGAQSAGGEPGANVGGA